MVTKIEVAKNLKYQIDNNKMTVQRCLGRKRLEDGTYVPDPINDKHGFSFSTNQHHSSKPIYLDAYCGYYGNSSVSMFNNDFYIQCMVEAINKFLPQLREETERIMERKYHEALSEAKGEAEEILKMIEELGLN